jgi:hypothetical protein
MAMNYSENKNGFSRGDYSTVISGSPEEMEMEMDRPQ